MKEYFLKATRIVNGQPDFNSGYLSVWENGTETRLVESIRRATEKGWDSKAPIFLALDIVAQEGPADFIISETCALGIVADFSGVKVKLYTAPSPDAFKNALKHLRDQRAGF